MRCWPIRRVMLSMGVLLLVIMPMTVAAQTPESDARRVGGNMTSIPATQRDIVTASNADAFLFGDEYPRADVVVQSSDLTCYRLIESSEYEALRTATVDITWCLNAKNGLVTAASDNWSFPDDLSIQGAFCGWNSLMGEMQIDPIFCKVLIQQVKCGPPGNPCINEELNWVLHGDGRWEWLEEWDIKPYAYEAFKPYPLSD